MARARSKARVSANTNNTVKVTSKAATSGGSRKNLLASSWPGPATRGAMSASGDVMVGEMRLRALMSEGADMLVAELDSVLGTAWDEALEPYRSGGDSGAEITWLSRGVG
mgnify:CR=1 FL=1